MASLSPKEIKLIKTILDSLNQEFPPQPIPVTIWKNNLLVKTVTTQDQHFNAYKCYLTNIWCITCNDYGRWQDSYQYLKEYCELFESQIGLTCNPAHTHPVYDAAKKRQFIEKKTCFWIGKLTWTD